MALSPDNNSPLPLMLAGDTSTGYCTVALCSCDTQSGHCIPLSTMTLDSKRLHSERLLGAVQWVLDEAGVAFEDLSCLAMTTGPGSFTGLRGGLAFWNGLALALQQPLISVPTLDALTPSFLFSMRERKKYSERSIVLNQESGPRLRKIRPLL